MIDLEHFNNSKLLGVNPENEEKVLIKIQIKNGNLWEREYFKNDKIQNIIDDFKESNEVDFPREYINDWESKIESLKITDEIGKLLLNDMPSNAKEIPSIILEKEIIPDIIGKPFSEPFEVFIFNKKNKSLNIQKYEANEIDKYKLNDYNSSSAYCNGNDILFISGGEKYNPNDKNKFWKINLNNQEIDSIEMEDKKNHSMIYIPGGYVLIVGGTNKKTYCYDEQNNQIWFSGDLNILRNEPALILISGILYCFDNINTKDSNKNFTFERNDLNNGKSEWELMTPNFNSMVSEINQKFFGIVKSDDGNILFLGGNMDVNEKGDKNEFNYSYNIKSNEIELSDIPFEEYNFKEKTFLPFNENIEYILPDFNRNHPEVIFYQKNKRKVNIVKYKPESKKKSPININTYSQKFNFNIPIISIPNNGTDNIINNNEEIDTKIDKPNLNTKNLSRNININNEEKKITVDQPPPYKAPEIDINKADMKISLNIPSNIFGNSNKEKDITMSQNDININNEINIENNDKMEAKDLDININGNFNIDNHEIKLNQNINNNNLKEQNKIIVPDIPKLDLVNIDKNAKINSDFNNFNNNTLEANINKSVKVPDYFASGVIRGGNKSPSKNNTKANKDINAGINIQGPKIDSNINSSININPSLNINNQYKKDVCFKGVILGKKSKNVSLGKIDIKGPEISSSQINVNSLALSKIDINKDVLLKGTILGTKDKNKNKNLNGPNKNDNFELNLIKPKYDVNLNTNMKGVMPEANIDNSQKNVNIKGPNLQNTNLEVISPKIELPTGGANFSVNGNINDVNIEGPKIDVNTPKFDIKKERPEINYNGPNLEMNTRGININGPKINNDIDMNGKSYGVKIDVPSSKINSKNIDLKFTKKDTLLKGVIPGIKKEEMLLKGPNFTIKGPNINANANINDPKIDINKPNLNGNMKEAKIDINGPNINADINDPNYFLMGIIPGVKKGNINAPPTKIGSNIGMSIKGDKINIPNSNIKEQKLNGKFGGNLVLKGQNPNLINDIQGIDLKDRDFFLSGLIPSKNDKNKKIIIDDNKNKIKISGKGHSINANGDYNHLLNKNNKINFHGSINDNNYLDRVDVKGSRRFKEIINEDKVNNANNEKNILLYEPKDINLNINKNLEIQGSNNIGGGEFNSGINIMKNKPTQLRIKTDDNNKFGVNVNIDGGNDINLNNLGVNYLHEENNNDNNIMLISGDGGIKKKGKGLPMVGQKNNNFEPCKIDMAGNFDRDKVNVENLRSINIGVNGQKIGDRIIY